MTQTVMNGATLSQLREGEDLVDIVARAVPEERLKIDTVQDVNLYTRQGTVVPLSQVARVETVLEEPVLWRRNRDMAITVRADVKDGEQGVSVTQSIRPDLKDIEARLPFGYRIDVGGAVEESDKANKALMAVAPVMLVTILPILMLQLQSFSLMTMVLLTAPLGLIGVVAGTAGHACAARLRRDPRHHRPERHDHAQRGDPGRPGASRRSRRASIRWSAVVDAAVHRTRPVVLTATATVLAMVPLTRSVFWGPMAIAIMGGLTVATVLTIFFVPALYAAWFRVRRGSPHVAAAPLGTAAPEPGSQRVMLWPEALSCRTVLLLGVMVCTGCASESRLSAPPTLMTTQAPTGYTPDIRQVGIDNPRTAGTIERWLREIETIAGDGPLRVLALSGGGAGSAFARAR